MERTLQGLAQNIDTTGRQLVHPKQQLQSKRQNLELKSKQLESSLTLKLKWQKHQLAQSLHRLQAPTKLIAHQHGCVQSLSQRLQRAQKHYFQRKAQRFTSLGEQLNLVSPLATLDRGFAIVRNNDNTILRKVEQTQKGESVSIQLSNGELNCNVSEIKTS